MQKLGAMVHFVNINVVLHFTWKKICPMLHKSVTMIVIVLQRWHWGALAKSFSLHSDNTTTAVFEPKKVPKWLIKEAAVAILLKQM